MRLRHTRLLATLAAFAVFQAPLCALACLDGSGSSAAESTEAREVPPCHEAPEPAEPAESHDDSCCSDAFAAALKQSEKSAAGVALATPPREHPLPPAPRAVERQVAVVPLETDLPPPDILLLKSTLLI